jgi:hypothetical protein
MNIAILEGEDQAGRSGKDDQGEKESWRGRPLDQNSDEEQEVTLVDM